jgi:hypothetical protein
MDFLKKRKCCDSDSECGNYNKKIKINHDNVNDVTIVNISSNKLNFIINKNKILEQQNSQLISYIKDMELRLKNNLTYTNYVS